MNSWASLRICYEEKSPTADSNVTNDVQNAFDDHLSHLGELFRKAHTEGLDKMFDEPKHLSDGFIKKNE